MNIYETDYTLWKQKKIEALTHKNWDVIDVQNLIEDLFNIFVRN